MENIIGKIIEMEKTAADIVREAEDKKRNYESELGIEFRRMEEEIHAKAHTKVTTLHDFEDGDQNRRLNEAIAQNGELTEALEANFAQNREKWVNEIFSRIVG